MAVSPHTERFTIFTFQEDATGTATVQSLCDYMQEAAGNHAAALGLSIERLHADGVAWVLSRMHVAVAKLPKVHETVTVTTWPVGVEGLQYRRDFIVRDASGGVLVRAASYWVVVSLDTRKVGRVPAFIAQVALDNAETAIHDAKGRFPEVDEEFTAGFFTARLSDIDRNMHVNNVRYLDWILESVPESIREASRPSELEILYKAESYHGDAIAVRTMPCPSGDGHAFCHSLIRETDGKELVRARTRWTNARQVP